MKTILQAVCVIAACALFPLDTAAAQSAHPGCTQQGAFNGTQTLQCQGVTIVAESGARFTLQDEDGNGRVDSVELSSKALLLEFTKKQGGKQFRVITPQAIAAVRGTRWAVDATEGKTSVFVVNGSVAVARRGGRKAASERVVLGAGDGVDVETTGALVVKRWPAPRVEALMARLGQ